VTSTDFPGQLYLKSDCGNNTCSQV
jgi:hypothetical protein